MEREILELEKTLEVLKEDRSIQLEELGRRQREEYKLPFFF